MSRILNKLCVLLCLWLSIYSDDCVPLCIDGMKFRMKFIEKPVNRVNREATEQFWSDNTEIIAFRGGIRAEPKISNGRPMIMVFFIGKSWTGLQRSLELFFWAVVLVQPTDMLYQYVHVCI